MSIYLSNVEAILAVDSQFGLAKYGKIPWKNKTDLQFFKNKTTNNVIIMGSKTLLSLPGSNPLPNRLNIIITNNPEKYSKKYSTFTNIFFVNLSQALDIMHNNYKDKTIFIIGGNEIYNLLMPYCSTIWLTQIKAEHNCDLIFNYDLTNFIPSISYEDDTMSIMRLKPIH
jgi:dihydrofolate reductase